MPQSRSGRRRVSWPLVVVTGLATALITGCGGQSDWTESSLESEGAALVKTQTGQDVTVDCQGGLTNKQGNSVMCAGNDGANWLFYPDNKGTLKVKTG